MPRKTTAKAKRLKDLQTQIRRRWPVFEMSVTGTSTVSREMAISLLRLDRIAPTSDPTGDHALQQLISIGVLNKPQHIDGLTGARFQTADILASLQAWAGVAHGSRRS